MCASMLVCWQVERPPVVTLVNNLLLAISTQRQALMLKASCHRKHSLLASQHLLTYIPA